MSGTTTYVPFTLTVPKPASLTAGIQPITAAINIITIGNPGPENINTAYSGLGYFSYIPPSVASIQFNNAGPPPIYVAATTAHGGAVLTTTSTTPPRGLVTIGLYNFDASSAKLFQINDTAAPGLQSGQVLQSAQVSYPVLASGAVGTSVALVRPTLPTTAWMCWRGNTNTIHTTDPDVFPCTIDTTNLVATAQVNIDGPGSSATLYVSTNGTTWIPQWTATPGGTSLGITTPSNQASNVSFAVQGTISGYATAPTLQYRDDSGTYVALPAGAAVTATSFTFTHPSGLAVGAHTVSVRDANNTAVTVTTGNFSIAAPVTPTVSVTTPSQPSDSTAFTMSGVLSGYNSPPSLTYADDGAGVPTALPAGSTVTTTAFSFTHPGLAAGSHTTVISDGTNSGSSTYSVATVTGGPSPDKSTLTSTTGSLTDNAGNRYTLTSGAQVAINGLVGTATSVSGLSAISNISNSLSGSTYTYTDVVLNNGSLPISIYWLAWQPGQNYLPSLPTPTAPSGWTVAVTGAAGGYGIEWTATTPLQPGQSVVFSFTSPDAPAVLFAPAASFPSVIVATATIEGVATTTGGANSITVPASLPQQTANQTFYVQAAFDYVPVKGANLQYSANSSGVVFGPFSANTSITWDSTGTIATIPISSGTQSIHYFQVQDTGTSPTTVSAELTYQVGTSGGGGTYTATAPTTGGTTPSALVVSSNNQPQVLIPVTQNVVEIAWVSGQMWYENTSNLWFYETSPSGPWLPTGGTLTSPLANAPAISLNAPTITQPNTTFVVTGTLFNYTAIPTLIYEDNGGPAQSMPSGAQVTLNTFSFTHPGLAAGNYTLLVTDGVARASVAFSIAASSWTSLPAQPGLTETISGLTPGASYDIEVYATNSVGQGPPSAILTVSTTQTIVTAVGIPTGLVSAGATTTAVNLVWLPPTSGATPTGYNTRYSPTGANTWTAGPVVTVSNAQITGLTSGTAYDFEVQAFNAAGSGAFSSLVTISTASAAPAVTGWQAQGASPSIAITNSNLTATAGGSATVGSTRQGVLSAQQISGGKAAFEVTFSGVSDSVAVGLVNSSFSLNGTPLGNDSNGIGYYPANVPASVATASVLGLPKWGVGVDLDYPSNTNPGASNTWTFFTNNFCTPRTCLQYPGGWDTQGNVTSYITSYAAGWKSNGYWNGTIAAQSGIPLKPCIPISAVPLSLLDGTVSFASAAAGSNNAFFTNILDIWRAAGFLTIAIRLCWEDNYPTTPAGQDASPGSNFPALTNGKASYCPWTFYGGGTAYANAFIAAWRTVAYAMKQHAAANGMTLTMVWGPTIINSNSIDWRLSYPDSVQTDGRGKLVDCMGPDFYFGNFWGDTTNLRSGYNTQQPFTAGTVTSTGATQAQFGADTGSKYYWADWTDGYHAPLNPLTTNLGYEGGMSMYGAMMFALQNNMTMMWCEFGGLDASDGGTNPKGNQNNGLSPNGSATWANEPSLAAYARTRIAWFQDKTKNGVANGTFLQFSFWRGQGQQMLQAFATEFPELVANPDAGEGSLTGGTIVTQAAIIPTTIRQGNATVLTPPGNAPVADTAGAVVTCCVDDDAKLVWFTSPTMRAAYGASAWNDSATANPATGTGGIPITVSGPLSICFSTGESGGVAVLNAGSGPFSFAGVPSTFPPWHGTTPTVTAPGQVTGLAVAQLQYSIAVPSSIPTQQTGTFFSIQCAFNYTPNQANLYYSPADVATTSTVSGVTVSPFSAGLSNGGAITWDGTGTVATFKFFFNTATTWSFQIFDTTAGINAKSAAVGFTTQAAAVSGGGGTSTATATAPSTAVSLSWTAPTTGSGPFTYVIMQSPTGAANYSVVGTTTNTSISLTGINPGVAYDYVVYAANGAGDGSDSALVTYTVPGTAQSPGIPTGLVAGTVTTTSVALSWQPPSTGATITGYQVQYKVASNSTFINYGSTTPSTNQVITGLTAGTAYNFQVLAFNSVGSSAPSTPAITATTTSIITPPPSNTIAQALLTKLQSTVQGTGAISGEYIGTGPITPINTIQSVDGQWLGLIGGDYWAPTGTGAAVTTFNANAISYWNAGGIFTISLSMPNPTTGGPCTDLSALTVADLLTAGTATNTSLTNMLGQVAAGLQALQALGVAVILRPFYRSNAGDFWWGTQFLTAAQYVALWQYTYNYLSTTKGLQNILWLWSAQSPFSISTQTAARYPGSAYVDMTGLDLFTSTTTTVTPTDVITVSPVANPTFGQTFSLTGTGTLPWTNAAAVQVSFGATQNFVSAQSAGYTVSLTGSNTVATVTGIPAPAAGNYTAYMKDSGTGITSAGVAYTVNPKAASGGASSVAGCPYLGWGLELTYPNNGFTTGGIDDATLVMQNFTKAFCKPTNMLLYTGSFASVSSYNFGIQGYLGTWNASAPFNSSGLGYNLIPIAGVPLTTTDGVMTFASIASGSQDASIQSYLQTFLTAGYSTIVLRISWEDNLPTTPGGQSAGSSQYGAAAVTNGGAAWGHYGGESTQSFATTIAGLPTGQAAFADAYIKAWRRFAWVVQQFALKNNMTVWKCWGPCLLQSGWFDPRLIYPDTASYMAADGWGKLVDVHGPDLYFGNKYAANTTNLKHGYDALTATAPFNGLFSTTGTAANTQAFFADIGSEYYAADFRGGGGSSQQTSYNSNPATKLPWSGGWGTFESMVWALQNQCMWGVPEGYATEGDDTSVNGAGKNSGTNLYGTTGFPPATDFPNIPEAAAYLRKRITWFQNESSNGIYAGQVLWMSFWGSSAGIEMLQAFAAEWPEFATNSGNNPLAGQVGVAFPTPN